MYQLPCHVGFSARTPTIPVSTTVRCKHIQYNRNLIQTKAKYETNTHKDGRIAPLCARPQTQIKAPRHFPENHTSKSVHGQMSSNAAKNRNPLKFVGVPQTHQQILAISRPKFTILSGHVEVLVFNNFFPIVDTCLSSEDIARRSGAMVPKWRFFASCISSEPRSVHFRPAF